MVYSAIRTFKIANAYVTNMVKCGKCNDKKGYLTTDEYDASDINNCIEKILVKEIDAVRGEDPEQSVILFAFGDRVYDKLKDKKNCFGKCNIYKLPHPASRLQNSYRKYVLFGQIYSALLENNFYEKNADMPNITDYLFQSPLAQMTIPSISILSSKNGQTSVKMSIIKSVQPIRMIVFHGKSHQLTMTIVRLFSNLEKTVKSTAQIIK